MRETSVMAVMFADITESADYPVDVIAFEPDRRSMFRV